MRAPFKSHAPIITHMTYILITLFAFRNSPKMRRTLVRIAKERGIKLRQSHERLSKQALRKQGGYSHARQMKRAAKQTKRLKTYLGRVVSGREAEMSQAG